MDNEEQNNKKILNRILIIEIISCLIFIGLLFTIINLLEEGILLYSLIVILLVIFVIINLYFLNIEVRTGYYECQNCHHIYKPESYIKTMLAPNMNRTRYLKCPNCNQRHWARKVYTK